MRKGVIENVKHYLLICSRYDRERAKLTEQVGFGSMWTEKLLGELDFIHYTLKYVKNTTKMATKFFQFADLAKFNL